MIPSPTDPMWGLEPLPAWVKEFRATQWEKVQEVVEAFKTHDVVFLQAPTGTGKTLLAEMTRRLLLPNGRASAAYVCSTKALQDQFAEDFPYGEVLKGRSNYLTESGPLNDYGNALPPGMPSDITCADCTYSTKTGECRWCSTRNLCPYVEAKVDAIRSPLAILNTSYFLTDANKSQGSFTGRDLTIIDECDLLEHELLNFVELNISPAALKRMDMQLPRRKTIESEWYRWVTREAIPKAEEYLATLPTPHDYSTDAKGIRRYYTTERLLEELRDLEAELPNGGWVYDPGKDEDRVVFKPVKVTRYGHRYIWPHSRKFLLMSASILSHHAMAEELGLNKPYTMIDVPGGYPKENRPVYITPIANNTLKNRDKAWPEIAEACEAVLQKHPHERILIHTVSYQFAGYLHDHLAVLFGGDRDVITYRNSDGKVGALASFLGSPGAVLVAASMDRGIDLPGDACRVQVIAKVPWPNKGDRRINARVNARGGSEWYSLQAIRTVTQMTGRGMRSHDDQVTTYIFDAQFNRLDIDVFPPWWREAISHKYPKRRLMMLARQAHRQRNQDKRGQDA